MQHPSVVRLRLFDQYVWVEPYEGCDHRRMKYVGADISTNFMRVDGDTRVLHFLLSLRRDTCSFSVECVGAVWCLLRAFNIYISRTYTIFVRFSKHSSRSTTPFLLRFLDILTRSHKSATHLIFPIESRNTCSTSRRACRVSSNEIRSIRPASNGVAVVDVGDVPGDEIRVMGIAGLAAEASSVSRGSRSAAP